MEKEIVYKVKDVNNDKRIYNEIHNLLSDGSLSYFECLGILDCIKLDLMEEMRNE